jgi:3-mercaptopyruvate sulfurtransferase SseA
LEAVYADEEDSGLSQSLKAATLSGQYPSMRSLLDILQRLGMTDRNPIVRYDQVRM